MTGTASVHERVEQAGNLAAILDATYAAFEEMLWVIGSYHDGGNPFYAALVMAAAAAADGRDAIAAAPSLPPASPRRGLATEPLAHFSGADAATALAVLSHSIRSRLREAAALADIPDDRAACQNGAAYADEANGLLVGNGP